jgi:hypothetical protein
MIPKGKCQRSKNPDINIQKITNIIKVTVKPISSRLPHDSDYDGCVRRVLLKYSECTIDIAFRHLLQGTDRSVAKNGLSKGSSFAIPEPTIYLRTRTGVVVIQTRSMVSELA